MILWIQAPMKISIYNWFFKKDSFLFVFEEYFESTFFVCKMFTKMFIFSDTPLSRVVKSSIIARMRHKIGFY